MGLQREIKKKRPFESLEQEALLNLLRTSDRVQLRFTRLFRKHGLFPAQYNILRILRGEEQPLPILEIAGRMLTQVPGITGLIDRLERAGLVARQRCTEDRRVIYVAITEPAQRLLANLDGPVLALHQELLDHLAAGELKELIRLLEKVRASLPAGDE